MMTAIAITMLLCITFMFAIGMICIKLGDSAADYLEAKAEELRERSEQLRKGKQELCQSTQ